MFVVEVVEIFGVVAVVVVIAAATAVGGGGVVAPNFNLSLSPLRGRIGREDFGSNYMSTKVNSLLLIILFMHHTIPYWPLRPFNARGSTTKTHLGPTQNSQKARA